MHLKLNVDGHISLQVSSIKLYLPLLRSLVVCEQEVSPEVYSGSLYCGDRNQVISVSLQQEAWLVGLKLLCRMLSGPILGALCDSHGRARVGKPMDSGAELLAFEDL